MRIGCIDNNRYSAYPPDGIIDAGLYIESLIADGIAKKGHEVTMYAPSLHNLTVRHVPSRLSAFYHDFSFEEWSEMETWTKMTGIYNYDADLYQTMLEDVKKGSIDLLHVHQSPFIAALPFLKDVHIPIVVTLHTIMTHDTEKIYNTYCNAYPQLKNITFVAISDYQLKGCKLNANQNPRTIYHGINIAEFPYNSSGGDYLSFVGRINALKGPHIAIQTALAQKRKLKIRGRVSTSNPEYYKNEVEKYATNPLIDLDTETDRKAVPPFFGHAKAFLFPVSWDEPFGLVIIEAMATGTPVIAYARGSVPEIIHDGVTGFIVNSSDDDKRGEFTVRKTGIEGLKEAVNRIYEMSGSEYANMRAAARKHVEQRFTLERMINNYEQLYSELLKT